MSLLHDPTVRESLSSRLRALRPDARRQWGKMTPDQMLRHLNITIGTALGHMAYPPHKPPIPGPVFRFIACYFPMPKGAPTHPAFVVGERYEFDAEKGRCLALLEEFARKPMDSAWPESPLFGRVTGKFNSRVQAKHVDHHLRQFSA